MKGFYSVLAALAGMLLGEFVMAGDGGPNGTPQVPLAPEAFRRPAGYVPRLYPKSLREISAEHSERMMKRAAKEMDRVDRINREGKWKATGASIDRHPCPEWFQDAKLGIFIDWGLWSLASWCPYRDGERMYPDWYERRAYEVIPNNSVSRDHLAYHRKNWGEDFQRDHFIDLFQARDFKADDLCRVFRDCGAKYVVPFLKHHSGFSLWDSSYTFRDVVDQGPKRDLSAELSAACKKNHLKFGFYFSIGEWEYPCLSPSGELKKLIDSKTIVPWTEDMEYRASGKVAVRNYFRDYSIPQAVEFIDKYDPDILWYDYDWVGYAHEMGSYDISAYFYNKNEGVKEVAVNDRYGNAKPEEIVGKFTKERPRRWLRTVRGDFFTDELGDTSECIDPAKYHPWECCRGISMCYGNHWQDHAGNVLSERAFICEFADIVARGGNLLLLVNLDGQGAIPDIQRERLLQIGTWLKRYGEAIYATRVLAPFKTPKIDYTRSKDGAYAYAIVKEPAPEITLACALPQDVRVTLIGGSRTFPTRRTAAGTVVEIPDDLAKSPLPFALKMNRK